MTTTMRIVLVSLIVLTLAGCSDEELRATERVVRSGYNAYYGQPAYYGPATTTVVTPAPVIY